MAGGCRQVRVPDGEDKPGRRRRRGRRGGGGPLPAAGCRGGAAAGGPRAPFQVRGRRRDGRERLGFQIHHLKAPNPSPEGTGIRFWAVCLAYLAQ